jgi:hypothetical protein
MSCHVGSCRVVSDSSNEIYGPLVPRRPQSGTMRRSRGRRRIRSVQPGRSVVQSSQPQQNFCAVERTDPVGASEPFFAFTTLLASPWTLHDLRFNIVPDLEGSPPT